MCAAAGVARGRLLGVLTTLDSPPTAESRKAVGSGCGSRRRRLLLKRV